MSKLLALITIVIFSFSAIAQEPVKTFPFTQAQNQDGAKYVWFIFGNAGFKYDYAPAKDIPKSQYFREVSDPQPGDIAWWPGYMAIAKLVNGELYSYLTAESERNLEEIEFLYGKPRFFRYQVFENAP